MPSAESDITDGNDRIAKLYPLVFELQCPLPRSWSAKDKCQYLGLSQNSRRVHYKGAGKNHKDAAAVRATHPIPAACGLYYFEVKIISKGRDGYMGIGFSLQGVQLNRLPGWDKSSYGYHGDDGCSFCSSGQGQPYGPTFTSGDVIGCGLNLVDRSCFYTKNGQHLGLAFTDLPVDLYPTVGLQTPGEIVDANFGQIPFVYEIEDEIREAQMRIHLHIQRVILPSDKDAWMRRLVSSYLVHHGYHGAAEAFNQSVGQQTLESPASVYNRQKIQKLILSGHLRDAIETVEQAFPGLLDKNPDLLFALKCRQFIEMINGVDHEPRKVLRGPGPSGNSCSSPAALSPRQTNSSPYLKRQTPPRCAADSSPHSSPRRVKVPAYTRDMRGSRSPHASSHHNSVMNGFERPVPMEVTESESDDVDEHGVDEGSGCSSQNGDNNGVSNGFHSDLATSYGSNVAKSQVITWTKADVDYYNCLLRFGRELLQLSHQLKTANPKNRKMLDDAYALLCYQNPSDSPLSYQLDAAQREPIAAAVNSTILESQSFPPVPALDVIVAHAKQLQRELANNGVGACAYMDPRAFAS